MSKTVLLTGGTGTIGTRLTQLLQQQGYQVTYLSREAKPVSGVTVYQWDIRKGQIDPKAIQTADYIVHLAGAGIADVLKRPLLMPNVPAFALKLLFGEMAITVLGGNYVINKRIADETSFTYNYADLNLALKNLLA